MKAFPLLLAALLGLLAVDTAASRERPDGDGDRIGGRYPAPQVMRPTMRSRPLAPLDQVIGDLQRRSPGRQIDSGLESYGGREVYRVRWLTENGRRIDYIVDATTGQVLGER